MRTFNCGGNWNNGTNNGVFYLNGNNARSNTNGNIGFRSALPPSQILQAHGLAFSAEVIKESVPSVSKLPAEKYQLQMPAFRLYEYGARKV